ncbi:MAG TPA: helix-turn-helix transcriptional regulator [Candidatus Scybalomonas excrementigallinarum]|nr:helix-turn-helix transcriptional regulator [Candidatus Scybalomonas excrementigallinarum]
MRDGYQIRPIKVSNLKKIRIRKQMTQKELAQKSGVPLKNIGNYEQLRRDLGRARVDIVMSLAKALDVTVEELINDN